MNITGVNKNNHTVYGDVYGNKANTAQDAQSGGADSLKPGGTVIVKFSGEGKNDPKKARNPLNDLDEMKFRFEEMLKQLDEARKQSEAAAEAFEKQRKCILIAMRIMCGDKVPPEDYRYLAEHAPGMLAMAIMMRRAKENPEEHKRVSEDEKRTPEAASKSGASESRNAETVQAVQSDGGEAE